MPTFSYRQDAELPDLWLSWKDSRRELIDFSSGWTFQIKFALRGTKITVLTKVDGILGFPGSLETDEPNVVIQWDEEELAGLDVGEYDMELRAERTADGKHRFWPENDPIRFVVVAAITDPEP